ncbi:MAG: type 4a pilus biogenesis protein PilO [Gammaproteobacteria bacterium]|jgi:type IV pilus assembly protein PilO|nr:type 4a pilus biogenesis protein PilO [Gammaproteobacteria bacterium]MBU2179141.1 type 4a pilus biogenesis protein PilO [Gammaproteobacteria bacterium]MBU2225734.1 type 4a pilus biogenesis protein PilO [Gammaproteobacteria bacterium]MBU2279147.1 type 4a pilus biogenesis protein PilO [Gammaproteobacteria bacterium]MBU2427318.1 type 4a pilus biogenesis protein PilO [Gammaproteobacteria bacterium]
MSMNFNLDELNNLDMSDMGAWPAAAKAMVVAILVLLIGVLTFYLLVDDQIAQLESSEAKEQELRQIYRIKYASAVNLELYKAQMIEMEQTFSYLLKQLPATHETPGLLDDITYAGTSTGLTFVKINWLPEIEKDFYTELPIKIDVVGDYHQFGNFVSEVAKLPRIVSLHDFSVTTDKDDRLVFNVIAKTYRYKEAQ